MEKILVISYFPVDDKGSMSLWTKDKVAVLLNLGFKVDLITSPIIKSKILKNLRFFNVHSITPTHYWREFRSGKRGFSLLYLPIVLTVGLMQEIVERIVLKRVGDGMWGWTIPSFIFLLILTSINKYKIILSLGGPTSSHLSTATLSNLMKYPSVIEFQDPIVGNDIGFNSKSSKFFRVLEKYLVSSRSKIVFVTKFSADECQARYPIAKNIKFLYTSSSLPMLDKELFSNTIELSSKITIAYFGEVYGTRNYDTLFLAFSKIGFLTNDYFTAIHHYGAVPIKNTSLDLSLINLDIQKVLPRQLIIGKALEYGLLLLIQHTDDRSKLTIPYKTWDYLNLQRPILAFLNNDELKELLDGLGHYTCDVNNVDSIVNAILRFLDDYKNDKIHIKPNPYDINKQVMELISL